MDAAGDIRDGRELGGSGTAPTIAGDCTVFSFSAQSLVALQSAVGDVDDARGKDKTSVDHVAAQSVVDGAAGTEACRYRAPAGGIPFAARGSVVMELAVNDVAGCPHVVGDGPTQSRSGKRPVATGRIVIAADGLVLGQGAIADEEVTIHVDNAASIAHAESAWQPHGSIAANRAVGNSKRPVMVLNVAPSPTRQPVVSNRAVVHGDTGIPGKNRASTCTSAGRGNGLVIADGATDDSEPSTLERRNAGT